MKWILFVLILGFNILFFVNWIYTFLTEVKDKFRVKAPKLYTCLCLCCRKSLYEEETRQSKTMKQNEQLIERIDNISDGKAIPLILSTFGIENENPKKSRFHRP